MKFSKVRPSVNGKPHINIAIPSLGYKNHVAIDQCFGFIRKSVVTHGARQDGSQLREVVTSNNTAFDIWADTAYRFISNEAWLKANSRVRRIHSKKPKGKPIPERMHKANSLKSKVRVSVEHVSAQQKSHLGLFIRTIDIKRAEARILLANLTYNMKRLIFHERRAATARVCPDSAINAQNTRKRANIKRSDTSHALRSRTTSLAPEIMRLTEVPSR